MVVETKIALTRIPSNLNLNLCFVNYLGNMFKNIFVRYNVSLKTSIKVFTYRMKQRLQGAVSSSRRSTCILQDLHFCFIIHHLQTKHLHVLYFVVTNINQNYEADGLCSNTSMIMFLNVTRDGSIENIGATDDSVVEVEYSSQS